MALTDLTVLNQYAAAPFPDGYPLDRRTFYAPVDQCHAVLKAAISSATRSLILVMYGFDDQELADIVHAKLADPTIYVQLTLDSSQAGGVHERQLLAQESYPASCVAIGRSEKGAIIHEKIAVVDSILTVSGSMNWSDGGESLQDNELTITLGYPVAAQAMARAGAIHAHVLTKNLGTPPAGPPAVA